MVSVVRDSQHSVGNILYFMGISEMKIQQQISVTLTVMMILRSLRADDLICIADPYKYQANRET